jgi:Arc/MetJ-type ribon-helix-helix transcriptional regulator
MSKPSEPTNLPERVASVARGLVATGRYATVSDVLEASMEALAEREQADAEWLAYARAAAERGIADSEQGRVQAMTPAEFSASLRRMVSEIAP